MKRGVTHFPLQQTFSGKQNKHTRNLSVSLCLCLAVERQECVQASVTVVMTHIKGYGFNPESGVGMHHFSEAAPVAVVGHLMPYEREDMIPNKK